MILLWNLTDAFQKYAKSVTRDEVLADVKIAFFPRHTYSMAQMITGWGTVDPYFKNIFQAMGGKAIPKYHKGKISCIGYPNEFVRL